MLFLSCKKVSIPTTTVSKYFLWFSIKLIAPSSGVIPFVSIQRYHDFRSDLNDKNFLLFKIDLFVKIPCKKIDLI